MEEIINIRDEPEILRSRGIHLIFGDINIDVARETVRFILEMNFNRTPPEYLTFIINSPGGELSSCFSIIDAMVGSKIPIHTIGIGEVASCGLLIFIAGQKGHRTLTKNTSILSHQWSSEAEGKQHELLSTVVEYNLTNHRIVGHYKKCTGLSEKVIREKLLPESDVWLSSTEAKKYKLCDRIRSFDQL
jgi:ATP-dependent Clp protease protease subunit